MTDLWAPGRRSQWLTRTVEVLILALFAWPAVRAHLDTSPGWLAHAVDALLFAAVLMRHRSLRWTAICAAAAALIQVAQPGTWATVTDLLYAPILYSFGESRSRGWRRFGLVSAIVGSLAAAFIMAPRVPGWMPHTSVATAARLGFVLVASVAVAIGGWSVGFMRRQSRDIVEARVQAQLDEAERVRLMERADQASERERIATEMHDVVAHSWAVVAAQADGARYALRTSPEQAERALDILGDTARIAMGDLRNILAQLRFQQPAEGFVSSEQQVAVLERLRASGLMLDFEETGDRPESPLLTLAAHRLLSEALTNALKHGDHAHPTVARLVWDHGFTLTVTNRIATAGPGIGARAGLVGMRERVTLAGGEFAAGEHDGTWTLHAYIPEGDE